MRRALWIVSILVVVAVILAACGGGGASAPAAAPTTAPAAKAPASGGAAATSAPAAGGAAATSAPAGGAVASTGKTLKFIGDANPKQWELDLVAGFEKVSGVKVEYIKGPDSATERLAQYLQFLSAQSGDLDVYQIDVIWPGILADHMIDLKQGIPADEISQHFKAIVDNNTVNGKLVGLPRFTDAGLLYYRKDLLQKYGYTAPPATWKELEDQAAKIQDGERKAGNDAFWGFVWQGDRYEGLTCDALEWQVSNGGGNIVEPDGKISINNPQAAAAFDRAAAWVGKISPPGVTTYKEEDSRGVWQAGNAAFMRNWPYAYSLGQAADSKIKDKFDVAPLPKGDGPNARNADTLGGWQLAVSKYSKNQKEAVEFVRYLAGKQGQKVSATQGSLLPTIGDLYKDADVLKAAPFFGSLFPVFSGGAVARPSTVTSDRYNEVSTAYFTQVQRVLSGQIKGAEAVANIEKDLQRILK